jgi:hypothetical protein
MGMQKARQHEVAFCAEVKSWSDALFQRDPTLPFHSAAIEQYGQGSHRRQDFRVYSKAGDRRGKLALCGERETERAGRRHAVAVVHSGTPGLTDEHLEAVGPGSAGTLRLRLQAQLPADQVAEGVLEFGVPRNRGALPGSRVGV